MEPHTVRVLCNLVCIFFLTRHASEGVQIHVRGRNIGDRYGLFTFRIPSPYLNSTLGPETYNWLVRIYGQATVDRNTILPALSDSHRCGQNGWCRPDCSRNETTNWKLKDVCGRFHCCVQTSKSD